MAVVQTNGIWDIYGDERDTTFVELVNIPVLELEGVRAEGVELHLKDKTNAAATAYLFDKHIHRNMLKMFDDSQTTYKGTLDDSQTTYVGSHGWYLHGVGVFKLQHLELLTTDREEGVRQFLDAVKSKLA
jgi:hypothetical protein